MNNKLKIYIIHYTKLDKRKRYIENLLSDVGIPYEFIESYDKELLDKTIIETYYEKSKEKHEKKVSLWGKKANEFSELTLPELSCSIKHIEALKKIKTENYDYSLILEDDVIPTNKNFINHIMKLINIEQPWDVLFIGEGMGKNFKNKKLGPQRFIPFKKIFKVSHPATNCLEAYIVKIQCIDEILNNLVPINLIIDWELAFQFYQKKLNIFWSKKNVFIQGSKNNIYKSELR
tara:strand:+ start:3012 stop:3710 length:699 start_codon:yes stop_codon:yes gene_type:complete